MQDEKSSIVSPKGSAKLPSQSGSSTLRKSIFKPSLNQSIAKSETHHLNNDTQKPISSSNNSLLTNNLTQTEEDFSKESKKPFMFNRIFNKEDSKLNHPVSLPDPQDLIKNRVFFLKKTLKFLAKNLKQEDSSLLRRKFEELPLSEIKILRDVICEHCFSIEIPATLSCEDESCLNCIEIKVRTFIENPSIANFKKISCPTCHLNITLNDIKKYLPLHYASFIKSDLKINCESCNSSSSAFQNYWTETPCTHICANCYTNSVYLGNLQCLYCNLPFEFHESSNRRKAKCDSCSHTRYCIGFLYSFFDQLLCFYCLQNKINNNEIKNRLREIKTFLNKKCTICKEDRSVNDVTLTTCCNKLVCDECGSQRHCSCRSNN